jgi:hypothetical protein
MPEACYCHAVPHMQVKNVPESTYAALRRRAASEGTTIRDFVLRLIERELARPSTDEWLDHLARSRPRADLHHGEVLEVIDAGRDEVEGRSPDPAG